MAAARPVLSTRVGGIPFQIDDSCGRLVDPENVLALREAFEALTSDPERLRSMGLAALAKVKAEFDWDRSAAKTYDLYCEVMQPLHRPQVALIPA
jgi:glycosyltransferase involved in cell wall biosynthesis